VGDKHRCAWRASFPHLPYVTLETPDVRERALVDPRGFLGGLGEGAVLDEVQRAPDLLSYLQGVVDEDPRPGRFVLTGSQNLLLLEGVSQSLAGRSRILHLHPFSLSELHEREPWDPVHAPVPSGVRAATVRNALVEVLHTGFYPRIHDRRLDPVEWLVDYRATYVERDLRKILNVHDLDAFGRFLGLCAGRSGHILNATAPGDRGEVPGGRSEGEGRTVQAHRDGVPTYLRGTVLRTRAYPRPVVLVAG